MCVCDGESLGTLHYTEYKRLNLPETYGTERVNLKTLRTQNSEWIQIEYEYDFYRLHKSRAAFDTHFLTVNFNSINLIIFFFHFIDSHTLTTYVWTD